MDDRNRYQDDDDFEQDPRPGAQVEAEVEELRRPDGSVPVELPTGKTIYVPMQVRWKKSAQDCMNRGDFDGWADSVLVRKSEDHELWLDWIDTDPEMGEVVDFFERLGKATGLAATGNRASRRSSQRTPRR